MYQPKIEVLDDGDDFMEDSAVSQEQDLPPLLTQLSSNTGKILIEEYTPEEHRVEDDDKQSLIGESETDSVLDLDSIQPQMAPDSTSDPKSAARAESMELLHGIEKMMSSDISKTGKITSTPVQEEEKKDKDSDGVKDEKPEIDDHIFEELD